jgi:uncharacterized protein DUF3558
MTRTGAILVVTTAVCAGALLAGCAKESAGSPRPVSAIEGSERPREIRLDSVDPCSLIPESDFAKYYFEGPGRVQRSKTFRSPQCFYGTQAGGFAITLVVTEGIEAWTGGQRNADLADAKPIQGFPAIKLSHRVDLDRCYVAVDVADGQYLLSDAGLSHAVVPNLPEKCDFAHQLAESAMKGLVASDQ